MKKDKKYSQKDLKMCIAIASFFTILSMLVIAFPMLPGIVDWEMWSAKAKYYYECILTIGLFGLNAFPILLVLCWYMCAERYVYLEHLKCVNAEKGKKIYCIWFSVAVIFLLGVMCYMRYFDYVKYFLANWYILDGLVVCILLKQLFWLLGQCF